MRYWDVKNHIHFVVPVPNVPRQPKNIPYVPIHDSIPKIKQYLVDQFNDTAFNPAVPFLEMNAPAAYEPFSEK